jgi:hypothetical protein
LTTPLVSLVKQFVRRHVRDAVSERRLWASRNVGSANEHLDSNRAAINLYSLEGRGCLVGLIGLGPDDGGASKALSVGSVLNDDPLGAANTSSSSKVVLRGVLVVVARYSSESEARTSES